MYLGIGGLHLALRGLFIVVYHAPCFWRFSSKKPQSRKGAGGYSTMMLASFQLLCRVFHMEGGSFFFQVRFFVAVGCGAVSRAVEVEFGFGLVCIWHGVAAYVGCWIQQHQQQHQQQQKQQARLMRSDGRWSAW